MIRYRFVRFIILMLIATAVKADYDLGVAYYEHGRFDLAYKEFMEAAEYGHKQAQFNIGAMYARGEYVDQDLIRGYAWLALSQHEQTDDENALHKRLYARFDEKQKKSADDLYGDLYGMYSHQRIVERIRPKNVDVRFRHMGPGFPAAVRRTAPEFPAVMLRRYKMGIVDVLFSVEKDGTTRDQLVLYSSDKGFERAAINATRGFIYEPAMINGKPVVTLGMRQRFTFFIDGAEFKQEVIEEAIKDLSEKAQAGSAVDVFRYAFYLDTLPLDVRSDFGANFDIADDWYWKAASQGHPHAAFLLGADMLWREGPAAEAGKLWLMKSADLKIADARYILAMEMLSGARLEKNEQKALYWLQQASEGVLAARVRYAWILSTHPEKQFRSHQLAKEYLDSLDKNYWDKQAYYQALAAQAAEAGDFREAIRWQKRAITDAKALKLPEQQLLSKLNSYNEGKPWRELP